MYVNIPWSPQVIQFFSPGGGGEFANHSVAEKKVRNDCQATAVYMAKGKTKTTEKSSPNYWEGSTLIMRDTLYFFFTNLSS